MEKTIFNYIAGLFIALLIMCGIAFGQESQRDSWYIVGTTYQLHRAGYPNGVVVCYTEDAMIKYMDAEWEGDLFGMLEMLFEVKTMEDVAIMKRNEGCTLISSHSQATIMEKGIFGVAHRAVFYAFGSTPMWGYYLYFGGKVK